MPLRQRCGVLSASVALPKTRTPFQGTAGTAGTAARRTVEPSTKQKRTNANHISHVNILNITCQCQSNIIEGSLEVILPTIWTVEKQR